MYCPPSQLESTLSPIPLSAVVEKALNQVKAEYKLTDDRVSVKIPKDMKVSTNILAKEMLWNIIDNAFKHGTSDLHIHTEQLSDDKVRLFIEDTAGGMPESVKTFLMNNGSESNHHNPGKGLGVYLIKNMSSFCNIGVSLQDRTLQDRVIGTTFILTFETA